MAAAAFLASIGASIAGLATDNSTITIAGAICTMLSAAIYSAAEAYIDGKSVMANTSSNVTTTTKTISAATNNAKDTVEKLLVETPTPQE
jgi:hypothetical protein